VSNDKLKFVKFDEKTVENNDNSYYYEMNGKSLYFGEILRDETKSLMRSLTNWVIIYMITPASIQHFRQT
jgi:hypothetical protein